MLKYTIKRLLHSLLTILIIVTIVFLLMRLLPTDYYFTEDELMKLTEAEKMDRLRAAGLLDNVFVQLMRFYKGLLRFDFGTSTRIQSGVAVTEVIASKVVVSLKLGTIALCFSLVVGVIIGVFSALFKGGLVDKLGTAYAIFTNAVPELVSYSLVLIFGSRVVGLPSLYSVRRPVISAVLPVVCLALPSIANDILWTRRYMVDELNKDYLKLAKLKGMKESTIMFKHVLRNAFVPIAQNIPGYFLLTISGSLLVERFFSVPGMGPLLADAIARYDTNVVQALVMLYATLGVMGVFLGDVLMAIIDPRISLTDRGDVR